jgi:glycosyltransferase involved in cell wall biosynthesis
MKFALITEIPAPYRIPLFNALAERVDLRVLFLAASDPRRSFYGRHEDEWRFEHEVLPGRSLRPRGRWLVLTRGLGDRLRRFAPDAIGVGGWNQPAFLRALAYAKTRRMPILSWVESTARDERGGRVPIELAKRALVRSYDGFFVPGQASFEYVRSFGVDADRIAVAPNAIDASVFDGPREAEDDTVRFLYVGRLDPEKGLDVLLRAFEHVRGELVLVGSGSAERELRARAGERVRFTGALPRDEVAAWYRRADAFVLPSRSEPWGMVLNEAATAGLPLVATEGVGAARELIEDGVNGFRVPVGDERALAEALRRLADDATFRIAAGSRSRELVSRLTPETWAEQVAGLARRLTAEGSRRGG